MNRQRWTLAVLTTVVTWSCGEPAAGPDAALRPSFAAGGVGRPSVLVNPNANDNGTAKTIQEGIDMVAEGGKVLVVPGTYNEALVIDKGLTLEGIGGQSEQVVIEQVLSTPASSNELAAIQVATSHPVVIRGITVHHVGIRGVNGFVPDRSVAVDLTIERVTFDGGWPFSSGAVINTGISVVNSATQSGGRARLSVRDSRIRPHGIGVALGGDIDAVIEGNTMGGPEHGACIAVSPTGIGATVSGVGREANVDILHNTLTECGVLGPGRFPYAIGAFGAAGATTSGTVNIVANTIRNTIRVAGDCNTAGIAYEFYSGRVEHNKISGVVQGCAAPAGAVILPAAIFVGSGRGFGPARPVVRFNNISGNMFAGLRVAAAQATSIDASCNYWGSANGPSGVGPGSGDAVVVEAGGAPPTFAPFATAPIAGTGATSCE